MNITIEELHDIIENNPEAKEMADKGNDSGALSVIFSALPKEPIKESLYTELGIIGAFSNPEDAEICLAKLELVAENNPVLKRIIKWLEPGSNGLDFGNPTVREQLDKLHLAGILDIKELNALKSLGEKTINISVNDISTAWARYRGIK